MIVLMPNAGFLSECSRMVAIAQALQAQGEAVLLATHGGPYLPVLRDSGLPLQLLQPQMDGPRCEQYIRDLVRIGKPGVRLQPADEVRQGVQAEVDLLRRCGARLVVIGFTLTAYLSARVAGVPLVASHGGSYVPPVFERGLAPVPTRMPIPGTNWLPQAIKRAIVNGGVDRMRGPTAFLNEVAAELGVEPVPTLAALMLGDLTLVTDVPEILGVPEAELQAWRPRRPAAYRAGTTLAYVGPLFARLPLPVPERVRQFLQAGGPVAYVVLSSATPALLRAVVQRTRAAGLRVLVGATVHTLPSDDDPGLCVAGLLPNHEVMPQVALAVTMGGQGTVQTAMASGTPLVAMPLHPEQELNVALAARQGMAVALSPHDADSPKLTAAVARVAADPAYAQAAQRTRGLYAGCDGAARSAAEIRRYLAQRQAVPRPAAQALPQAA